MLSDTVSHIAIFLFPNRLLFQKKATLRRMKKEWCFEYKEIVQLLNALLFHWLQWMNFKCDYEWYMAGSFYHVIGSVVLNKDSSAWYNCILQFNSVWRYKFNFSSHAIFAIKAFKVVEDIIILYEFLHLPLIKASIHLQLYIFSSKQKRKCNDVLFVEKTKNTFNRRNLTQVKCTVSHS